MNVKIEESWRQQLQEEFNKPYFEKLVAFVKSEYERAHILPLGHQIFHVFNSCPFEKVKVVILGQDPYPQSGTILWNLLFRSGWSNHSRIISQYF